MKSASLFMILVFSLTILVLASVVVESAVGADPVIVGKWDRTDGDDKYTIYADRTTQTVLPDGTHHGTWELDGSSGYKYIFRWDFGPSGRENFIDYVTVAADGQSYSGVNNYGNQFHCVRVGGADSVPAEDSGFPIAYVAVGGGIAAAAAVGAAVYFFHIARGGAEAASSSNAVHREVAQSTSDAVVNLQSPKVEGDQYLQQSKNRDLKTSEKHKTKSKAQNQPAQEDTEHYGTPLEQPDEPPDERTG